MKRTNGYLELLLPEGTDAASVFLAIARGGIDEQYLLYADDTESRIALGTAARVCVSDGEVRLEAEDGHLVRERAKDPFAQVSRLLRQATYRPHWTSYGHVSFDISRHYLPYGHEPEVPELLFTIPQTEIVVSGTRVRIRGARSEQYADLLRDLQAISVNELPPPFAPLVDHGLSSIYHQKVRSLTSAIKRGELEKAILSRRVVFDGHLDVASTYAVASRINSGVRTFGFRAEDIAGVGFSPEVLVEATPSGIVTTTLLAGTRRRGVDAAEDAELEAELLASAKEVKEHAISVRLAQEEMRAVCMPETVRVGEFMHVRKFRSVQHLGSTVSGKLSPEFNAWDALRILFPAITVAGVPKAQALQWIGKLEEHPRGLYGGVVGIIESSGRLDLALAIRSAFEYSGQVHLNAGAGIVAESDPEFEYMESVNKMKMMLGQTVLAGAVERPQRWAVGK